MAFCMCATRPGEKRVSHRFVHHARLRCPDDAYSIRQKKKALSTFFTWHSRNTNNSLSPTTDNMKRESNVRISSQTNDQAIPKKGGNSEMIRKYQRRPRESETMQGYCNMS